MTDENEYTGSPLHLPDRDKGSFLHTTDMATVIARPGDDRRDLATRVRGFVNRGYLHPVGRDKNDARSPLLFDATGAVTAAALLAATDAGLSGKLQFSKIAVNLQSTWQEPDGLSPCSRAAFIFKSYQQNPEPQGWGVELHTSRNPQTGQTAYHVAVRHGENGYLGLNVDPIPEGYLPVATLLIPLDTVLPDILQNLMAMHQKRGMN